MFGHGPPLRAQQTRWASTWYYWLLRSYCRWQKCTALSGFLSASGAQWLCRLDLRSLQSGRARSILCPAQPRNRAIVNTCPQYDGQTTRTRGRMVWCMARLGWYPRTRLFAYPSRSRSRAYRAYGQFGWWYYDQLDLAGGSAFYYGCPQLLCHHVCRQSRK